MRKIVIAIIIVAIISIIATILAAKYSPNSDEKVYCTPASRQAQGCTAQYAPVCGWFNPEKIQCIKYPCAQSYGNACEACINENVEYTTRGACPE